MTYEELLKGRRIRLLAMPQDPDPIPYGTEGTVTGVREFNYGPVPSHQIDVEWDGGRTLMLCSPPDRFEVLPEGD